MGCHADELARCDQSGVYYSASTDIAFGWIACGVMYRRDTVNERKEGERNTVQLVRSPPGYL